MRFTMGFVLFFVPIDVGGIDVGGKARRHSGGRRAVKVLHGNISGRTAISGLVVVALLLAGGGFLLGTTLDSQSAGSQMQSSQPVAWQTVMKWFSHRLHNSSQQ